MKFRLSFMFVAASAIASLGIHPVSEVHAGNNSFVVRYQKTQPDPNVPVWIGAGFIGNTPVDIRATILMPFPTFQTPTLLNVPNFKFEVLTAGSLAAGNPVVLHTALMSGFINFAPGGGNPLTAQIAFDGSVVGGSRSLLRARTFNGVVTTMGTILFKY